MPVASVEFAILDLLGKQPSTIDGIRLLHYSVDGTLAENYQIKLAFDGAAKGAAIGGGAGTGVVLATKGKEIRLAPGADVTSQLSAPLTVRVRIG